MKPCITDSTPISKIAIYGKGGIGKSTISANISAALADEGYSVLHIGCDPKHDSTRALLGELQQKTVTDFIRSQDPEKNYDELIRTGYNGIACVEAGGPEPGVGCAGRGILSTFEILSQMEIDNLQYSYIMYDVLGDVVCGGFAVPLRHGYADLILIVTSGEYMSLYAANNILRGIRNFDGNGRRIGGIIYNSRGGAEEDGQVQKFAEAVRLPLLVKISRSELFLTAERHSKTVISAFPDTEEASLLRELASRLTNNKNPLKRHQALPLEVSELESLILNRTEMDAPYLSIPEKPALDCAQKPDRKEIKTSLHPCRPPLFGCAFAGAIAVLTQIEDASIIAHCPASCAHIVSNMLVSTYNRNIENSGIPSRNIPISFIQTGMDDTMVVFGGIASVAKAARETAQSKTHAIFIVSSCTPGITGDKYMWMCRGTCHRIVHPGHRGPGEWSRGRGFFCRNQGRIQGRIKTHQTSISKK